MEAKVISEIIKALDYLKENTSQIEGDKKPEFEKTVLFCRKELKRIKNEQSK